MNKRILVIVMMIVYVFISLWSPVGSYASTTDVNISSVEAGVDANMVVSIAGNISPITEQMVTVSVIDPFGYTDYVNSTFSDSKGEFKFSYILKNKYVGKYNVMVSGAGIKTPIKTNFEYGTNPKLSSLSVSSGKLDPVFNQAVESYTINVDARTTQLEWTATVVDSQSDIKINDVSVQNGKPSKSFPLKEGENIFKIYVKALSGATKSYTVIVKKYQYIPAVVKATANIDKDDMVTINGNISSGKDQQVSISVLDPQQNLTYINHVVSDNSGNFVVTYPNKKQLEGEYKVTIGGDGVGNTFKTSFFYGIDVRLQELSLSSGAMDEEFDPEVTEYSTTVDKKLKQVYVNLKTFDERVVILVNGREYSPDNPIDLVPGINEILIKVTGLNGVSSKTYKINANSLDVGTLAKNVQATIDKDKRVVISGTIYPVYGQEVSVVVTDPKENIDYVNSMKVFESSNGSFTFSYLLKNNESGEYKVNVGAVDMKSPVTTSFVYGSINADLKGFLINGNSDFTPEFNPEQMMYNAYVSMETTSVTIKPLRSAAMQIVQIDERLVEDSITIPVSYGSNNINMVVSSPDGKLTRQHLISVYRQEPPIARSSNANLSGLTVSGATLNETFASGTVDYTASVTNSVSSVTISPVCQDSKATIETVAINNRTVVTWDSSTPLNLSVGTNVITITVKAEDGTIKIYTIAVNREAALVNAVAPVIKTNLTDKTTIVGAPVTLDVTATVSDGGTITYQWYSSDEANTENPTELAGQTSSTYAPVVTTAGTFCYYCIIINTNNNATGTKIATTTSAVSTVTVTAPTLSGNADLSSLTVSEGILSPAFDKDKLTYTVNVENSVCSATIEPTVSDANATVTEVTLRGSQVTKWMSSTPLDLSVGTNAITITVKAENGTEKTYTITLTRAAAQPTTYAVTFSVAGANGKLEAKVGNVAINSGDTVEKNKNVVFTATPSEGYKVKEWTLNGETVANNTTTSLTVSGLSAAIIVTVEFESAVMQNDGHYYIFVSAPGISWTAAKAAAEKMQYLGQTGYLATITSKEENDFVKTKLKGQGWLGGSDDPRYTNDVNGKWYWVTGPEAGTKFATQNSSGSGISSTEIGMYQNFDDVEPNDYFGPGTENYLHMYGNDDGYLAGKWNDYANTEYIDGYVVEFGGSVPALSGNADLSSLMISGSTLNETFASETVAYTASVANSVSSVTISPVCQDSKATIETVAINNSPVDAWNSSTPLNLSVGANVIIVTVKAENGTTKAYTITLTRAPDTTKPIVTAGVANRISDTLATVKFTSSEAGEYYTAVVDKDASAPTIDNTASGTDCTTAEVTASATLTAGAKDVYVVVKDAAGNVSDAVKIPVEAYVAPDTTKPIVTAGAANRTSDRAATVKFTSSEAGEYYTAVVEKDASAPTIDTSVAGTGCTTAEVTASVTLTAGAKDVYVVVKDAAGNVSDAVKIAVGAYVATPSAIHIPDDILAGGTITAGTDFGSEYVTIRYEDNTATMIDVLYIYGLDDDIVTNTTGLAINVKNGAAYVASGAGWNVGDNNGTPKTIKIKFTDGKGNTSGTITFIVQGSGGGNLK